VRGVNAPPPPSPRGSRHSGVDLGGRRRRHPGRAESSGGGGSATNLVGGEPAPATTAPPAGALSPAADPWSRWIRRRLFLPRWLPPPPQRRRQLELGGVERRAGADLPRFGGDRAPWHEAEAARWRQQAARPPPQDPASWAGRRRRHSRAPGGRAASTSSLPSSALLAGGGVGVGGCRPLCCWPPHLGLLVPSATGAPPSGWRRPHDIPIAAPPRPPPSLGDDIALFLPSPAMRKGKRSTAAVLPPLHDGMICIGVFFFCRSATGTCWSRS
jgi:hypothetical protein